MNFERIDTETLTKMINLCFDLSMSGAVPEEFHPEFLAAGKRMRGSLVNLLSLKFDAQAAKFIAASDELKKVNKALKKTSDQLTKFADTIEKIGSLVGILDDLLTIAASVV